jgi:hypothetical protein
VLERDEMSQLGEFIYDHKYAIELTRWWQAFHKVQ